VETPFIELGQLSTALYFGNFLLIVPAISLVENTLIDLSSVAIYRLRKGNNPYNKKNF
jgi:ubiquinol-cytochrome c reductase cytochrome b subunit